VGVETHPPFFLSQRLVLQLVAQRLVATRSVVVSINTPHLALTRCTNRVYCAFGSITRRNDDPGTAPMSDEFFMQGKLEDSS
jgi:hypothetical protein